MMIKIGDKVRHACENPNCNLSGVVEDIDANVVSVRVNALASAIGDIGEWKKVELEPEVKGPTPVHSLEFYRGYIDACNTLLNIDTARTVAEVMRDITNLRDSGRTHIDAILTANEKLDSPETPNDVDISDDQFIDSLADLFKALVKKANK